LNFNNAIRLGFWFWEMWKSLKSLVFFVFNLLCLKHFFDYNDETSLKTINFGLNPGNILIINYPALNGRVINTPDYHIPVYIHLTNGKSIRYLSSSFFGNRRKVKS
jgi:hypothetical protein